MSRPFPDTRTQRCALQPAMAGGWHARTNRPPHRPPYTLGLPRAWLQAHLQARGCAIASAAAMLQWRPPFFSWHHNPFTHGLRLHLPRKCPSLKPLCIAQSFPNTLATLRLLFAELCAEHVDQLCCQRDNAGEGWG